VDVLTADAVEGLPKELNARSIVAILYEEEDRVFDTPKAIFYAEAEIEV